MTMRFSHLILAQQCSHSVIYHQFSARRLRHRLAAAISMRSRRSTGEKTHTPAPVWPAPGDPMQPLAPIYRVNRKFT
jgi:hypothetical protein